MKEPGKKEGRAAAQCQVKGLSPEAPVHEDVNRSIRPGDTVQILQMAEILQTLDEHMQTEHVWFMPWMATYCGMTVKVLKQVNHIFDERAWKMLKCKKLFILEGLVCEGRDLPLKYGCQRNCYFFWKEAWLRKI